MSETRAIELQWSKGGHSPDTYIAVDGKKVARVSRVTVDLSVGDIPKVVIECFAMDGFVSIDETDVSIEPHVMTRATS